MPVASTLARIGSGVRAGRSALSNTRAASFLGRNTKAVAGGATAAFLGYKALKGFGGQVVPAAIDAAQDIAFDNPEADRSVLGTDLSASMYLGVNGPRGVKGIARGMNATRFGVGVANPLKTGAATGVFGAAAGAGIGFARGGRKGAVAGGIAGAIGGGILRRRRSGSSCISNS